MTANAPELTVIACNYAAGTSIARPGARAYLLWRTGGDNRRCEVVVHSRGGRWVTKWEPIVMLEHFRIVHVPTVRPEYARLAPMYARADHEILTDVITDIVACQLAALGERRWRGHLERARARDSRSGAMGAGKE